jgi:hypothetical protein
MEAMQPRPPSAVPHDVMKAHRAKTKPPKIDPAFVPPIDRTNAVMKTPEINMRSMKHNVHAIGTEST